MKAAAAIIIIIACFISVFSFWEEVQSLFLSGNASDQYEESQGRGYQNYPHPACIEPIVNILFHLLILENLRRQLVA
jgi:hypothetical protein